MNSYTVLGNSLEPRGVFELEDTGFNEVPKKFQKYYRAYRGSEDKPAENEVLCPVCRVIIRSEHTLLPGDKVYCLVCSSWLKVSMRDGQNIAVPFFE